MRHGQLRFNLAGAIIASIMNLGAQAQCETWYHPQYGVGPFWVNTVTEFKGELIAGGNFEWAGFETTNNIARWNGSSWQAFGSGVNDQVAALVEFEGNLIVGGLFNEANGIPTPSGIARWNGATWEPMGFNSQDCYALIVFQGNLLADTDNGMKKWTGNSWESLGFGVNEPAHVIFDDLLLLASFENVYQWDGVQLQQMGGAVGDWFEVVTSIAVFEREVYVGILGDSAGRIAKWNGAGWETFTNANDGVTSMLIYDGKLTVAGFFTSIADTIALRIAQWDGNDWQQHANGFPTVTGATIYTLGQYQQQLVVGGFFQLPCCNLSGGGNIALWQPCPPCAGDLTGDSQVNVADLLVVINAWGPCAPCVADVNGDDVVNVADMLAIINAWGSCS